MAGRGYGISDYGQSLYGETKYLDGIAAVSATASNTSACERIALGSASLSASSSVSSPTGEFMVDASANTIQATSATASGAVEVFDGLASGGGSAAGSTASGTRVREVSATSTASSSNSASLQFITNAVASGSASATPSISYERVREFAPEISGTCTFDASANFTVVNSATVTALSATDNVNYIRERNTSGQTVQGVLAFASVDGREKWERLPYTSTDWSDIAA